MEEADLWGGGGAGVCVTMTHTPLRSLMVFSGGAAIVGVCIFGWETSSSTQCEVPFYLSIWKACTALR